MPAQPAIDDVREFSPEYSPEYSPPPATARAEDFIPVPQEEPDFISGCALLSGGSVVHCAIDTDCQQLGQPDARNVRLSQG